MTGIARYKREEIKQFIKDGICPVQTLRDYDIIMSSIAGKKMDDITFENRISREQVWRIKQKYMNGLK
jgi:hypothetical protein